ncbi:MAG: GAP family protein [Solirubrobacteraceae bacterium]
MIRLLGLMISVGIADSLNPTTIAPALYLAAGNHPRRQVAEFTLAVFAVYTLGGLAVALGPGQLLLALVPRPGRHLGFLIETIAGGVMIAVSVFLFAYRKRLAASTTPEFKPRGRSSAVLGATITAVELPTAFPYFAAIAAVVGADLDVVRLTLLIVVFNICFILPLMGILLTLSYGGPNAKLRLARARRTLEARWPMALAVLALAAGLIISFLGATGLGAMHHNDFGTFARKVRRLLHLKP